MTSIATVKARTLSEYRPLEKAASPLRRKAAAYVCRVAGGYYRITEAVTK